MRKTFFNIFVNIFLSLEMSKTACLKLCFAGHSQMILRADALMSSSSVWKPRQINP